jgi:hypothetical protein
LHNLQIRQPIISPALILGAPRSASVFFVAGNEEGFGSGVSGISARLSRRG